jgi:signal transduction histidine kinase
MQIQASKAIASRDPRKAQDALDKALEMTHQALADVRRSVASLRSPAIADLPLPEMIRELIDHIDAGKIKTQFQVLGTPRELSPQARMTFYRSAQEALNNAIKHAQASVLLLTLDFRAADSVTMIVQDNGQGAEDMNGGFGLIGMKERANLLNGEVKFSSAKGQGFSVEIWLPG